MRFDPAGRYGVQIGRREVARAQEFISASDVNETHGFLSPS